MGFRILAAILFLIGFFCLPFWPYVHPWSPMAVLGICGFCFFVAALLMIVSFIGPHGSAVWRGRGHG